MAGQRAKPVKIKHIPHRTCVACREVNAKRQLVRLVRTADGRAQVDPTGKAAGRGAYLHERRACWERALSRRELDRALRINLSDADRAALLAHGEQYSDDE
jgi:predicted RNA-binding protein YlxR (DUF448 family)